MSTTAALLAGGVVGLYLLAAGLACAAGKPFDGRRIGSHHGGHWYVDVGKPDCGLDHEHDSQCFPSLRAGSRNPRVKAGR